MLKTFVISLFLFSVAYSQTSIDKLLNDSWVFSKNEFHSQLKGKDLEEKESMGYSGYIIADTLEGLVVDVGFFFNSSGIQKMRAVMNKNKSEKESQKLFVFLFSSINKLLGTAISDNEMMGARMIQWKKEEHTIILTHSSNNCILSIIK